MEKEEIQGSGFMQLIQKLDRHKFILVVDPADNILGDMTTIRVIDKNYPKYHVQQVLPGDHLYLGKFLEVVEFCIEKLCNLSKEQKKQLDLEIFKPWEVGDTFFCINETNFTIECKTIRSILIRQSGVDNLYFESANDRLLDLEDGKIAGQMYKTPEKVADIIRGEVLDKFMAQPKPKDTSKWSPKKKKHSVPEPENDENDD